MDWKDIQANWTELTGAVLTRWPEAEEDRLLALDVDHDAFVAYIARCGTLPIEEALDRVHEWAQTAMPTDVRMKATMVDEAISDSGAHIPPGEEPADAEEAFGDESRGARTVLPPPIGRTPE